MLTSTITRCFRRTSTIRSRFYADLDVGLRSDAGKMVVLEEHRKVTEILTRAELGQYQASLLCHVLTHTPES